MRALAPLSVYKPFLSHEDILGFDSSRKYSLGLSSFFFIVLLHQGQSLGSSAPKSHCHWVRLTFRLQVGHCLIASFYYLL